MIGNWLKEIAYEKLTSGIDHISNDVATDFTVYTLSGKQLMYKSKSIDTLQTGIYIINGNKTSISR